MSEPVMLELWETMGLLPGKWADNADCKSDPDLFHAEKGQGGRVAAAKRICEACPVKSDCLDFALENREPWGVWGGVNAPERLRLLKARDAAAKLPA